MTLALSGIADTVLALSLMGAVASLLVIVTRRLHIPLSLILVIVGFVAGELGTAAGLEAPLDNETFRDLVTFVLLPVLVFEAAFELPVREFMKNLAPILALAVPAMLISAAIVGLAVHYGLGVAALSAALFGILISATDPVSVTAVFRGLGVPKRLLVLVEGESLLNDAVTIVLFQILVVAAVGTGTIGAGAAFVDFVTVFFGGAALGAILGLAVAELAGPLGRLPSTALTIATAFGSFVLAEEILGFSGVMASVSAGLVLAGLSRTVIPSEEAETWHSVWETLAFVANALLFLLLGLALDAGLFREYWDSILLAVAAVLIARPIAVVAVTPAVTRLARLPALGARSQAVLIWSGLRGAVALALVLSIPSELADQERFLAMTAGVVLATLLLNATTIGLLVSWLGLDRPDRTERFITEAVTYRGARAARQGLTGHVAAPAIERELRQLERRAVELIDALGLQPAELRSAYLSQALSAERARVEDLVDNHLLAPERALVLLASIDDRLDLLRLGGTPGFHLSQPTRLLDLPARLANHPRFGRHPHLGRAKPSEQLEVAFRDLRARQEATYAALEALDQFRDVPGADTDILAEAVESCRAEQASIRDEIEALVRVSEDRLLTAITERYASDLAQASARRELDRLVHLALISEVAVEHAQTDIGTALETRERVNGAIRRAMDAEGEHRDRPRRD